MADGRMLVLIADPSRPRFSSDQLFEATEQELAAAARGCVAYSGRWKLRGDQILHEVDASLFPNWVGVTLARKAQLTGNRLTLSTAPFSIRGVKQTAVLVWEKEL